MIEIELETNLLRRRDDALALIERISSNERATDPLDTKTAESAQLDAEIAALSQKMNGIVNILIVRE